MDRHRRSASLFTQQFSTRFPSTSLDSQSHSICTHMVRIACAAMCRSGSIYWAMVFWQSAGLLPFLPCNPQTSLHGPAPPYCAQHMLSDHIVIHSRIKTFTTLDTCTTERQRSGEIAYKKSIGWNQKQKVIRNWDRACNLCSLRAVYKDVLQCSCQNWLKIQFLDWLKQASPNQSR